MINHLCSVLIKCYLRFQNHGGYQVLEMVIFKILLFDEMDSNHVSCLMIHLLMKENILIIKTKS